MLESIKKPGPGKQLQGAERPVSGTIRMRGKMVSASSLKVGLSRLSAFRNVDEKGGCVSAMIVESADREGRPHLYISFLFGPEAMEAEYSIPPEVPNPAVRGIEVAKTVFTALSLLEIRGAFLPEKADLYQKTMEVLDSGIHLADADTLKARYRLDSLLAENSSTKAELAGLKAEKEGLNHQLLALERGRQDLEERVKSLEKMTDSELDREIIHWVGEHNGKLDSGRFCVSFGIGGQRLEERLDSLAKQGVLKVA
jgi:chaperonin cofactor prefoldin